jgi:hypothetical protein
MSHVNVTAMMKSAYCDRSGICPQRIAPRDSAPRPRKTSMTVTPMMHASTASTW